MANEIIDQRHHKNAKVSLILSCYNQEKSIGRVLEALQNQTYQDFEILVTDDGSTDDSKKIILGYPVCYVSQDHLGFRKARILNKAISQSAGEYIILLDGDCVPHHEYVEAHMRMREKGYYLAGRRIDLDEKITEGFFKRNVAIEEYLWANFWKVKKLNRMFVIKNPLLRKISKQDEVCDMMGCNASFWREDFFAVDGFDESYEGYFREDGDLEMRFRNLGLKIKSVKGLALIFHCWHERRELTKDPLEQDRQKKNEERFQETIRTRRVKAIKGLGCRAL